MAKLVTHPFRDGIMGIITQHFAPEIAKHFMIEFEANTFHRDNQNIWAQLRGGNYVVEVYYQTGPETREYVCDLFSWESRPATTARFLAMVTTKVRDGKFGQDWVEKEGRIDKATYEATTGTSRGDEATPRRLHNRRKGTGKADSGE